MTPEELTAQRDALLAARYRGVRTVEIDGRRVTYARAAAWIAGADRWTEAMWRNLEQQVGAPELLEHEQAKEPDASSASIAGVLRRRLEKQSRRVFRSSYMS